MKQAIRVAAQQAAVNGEQSAASCYSYDLGAAMLAGKAVVHAAEGAFVLL